MVGWNARLAVCLLLMPVLASAQTGAGSIAGVVRDTTGAVLPGVTVEASSPALIEKVRSVVSDGEGQYKIIELRPGPMRSPSHCLASAWSSAKGSS